MQLSASRRESRPPQVFGAWSSGESLAEIEQVIEFFGSRREAERMLAEVLRDEPHWLEQFRIERIELGSESSRIRGQPICVSGSPREATK